MSIELTREELRSFIIRCHMLDNFSYDVSKEGIFSVFQRLGCIQYDPLNVIGRNVDLVLQSRLRDVKVGSIDKYLYEERLLIEGWDKEMSIYQMTDWPYFSRIRTCYQEGVINSLRYRGQMEALDYTDIVVDEIESRGPLNSNQLKFGTCNISHWGHRQLSGATMNYLFASGRLGVLKRSGVQRTYELIENILPFDILSKEEPFKNDSEFIEWYFLRRITSLGVCWSRTGGGWNGYYLSDLKVRKRVLHEMTEKGLIIPIQVSGIQETLYINANDVHFLNSTNEQDGNVRYIAPLDNFLWDRELVKKIFDFDYSWEVYLPKEKRKYGYYVIPVLYRNHFIARMEPVKQDKNKPFTIKNWWWEKHVPINSDLKEAILESMIRMAEFLQADGYAEDNLETIFGCSER